LAQNLYSAAETTTELPSEWIEKHFYVPDPRDPETGELLPAGPLRLFPHQKRIIDEALSRKPNGMLKYSTVIYSAPKKSGKSTLSSAVVLYTAYHNPYSFVACVANDVKQSSNRLYGPIVTSIHLHKRFGGILKDASPNRNEIILPNHTKIEAIPCDAPGEAGAQPLLTAWCFDEETEILTKDGWKRYYDLDDGSVYATMNPETGNFEWQQARALNVFPYKGKMYLYETSRMSACVTPNHRFIGRICDGHSNKTEEYSFEIQDVVANKSHRFIQLKQNIDGKFEGKMPAFIEDGKFSFSARTHKKAHREPLVVSLEDFLELLAWFLSEGCVKYKRLSSGIPRPECVMIGVSKEKYPENFTRIWQLLERMGLTPKHWKNNQSICFYDIRVTAYFSQFGLSYDKHIPTWVKELPTKYLEHFLYVYYLGDGYLLSKKKDYGFAIGTISKRMAEDLSEIGIKAGYGISMQEYDEPRSAYNARVIRFRDKNKRRYVGTDINSWEIIDYNGYVWCPSTKNGIVFVRRNRSPVYASHNSELWGFTTEKKKQVWTELTLPPTLYGKAIRWVETYAGYQGESELLEQLYDVAVIQGKPHPDFLDLTSNLSSNGENVVFINEQAGTFAYWDHEPRLSWQEPEYYQMEMSALTPGEFSRLHRNLWVSSISSFIQEVWWDKCLNENLMPLKEGDPTPVIVGIDMAVTRDCAALVAVTRDPFQPDTGIAVRAVRVFSPRDTNGIIDQENDVAPVLREWARKWNVICFVYDPREMAKLAQDLSREGLGWFDTFGQTAPRAIADKQLHDMIVNRQVSWNPHSTEGDVGNKGDSRDTLYKHLSQAGATTKGDGYRIEKLSQRAKVDAAVALSMAASKAMELSIDNLEFTRDRLLEKLARGEITPERFSELVRRVNPKLEKLLRDGRQ